MKDISDDIQTVYVIMKRIKNPMFIRGSEVSLHFESSVLGVYADYETANTIFGFVTELPNLDPYEYFIQPMPLIYNEKSSNED